jgi:hypothetical protein
MSLVLDLSHLWSQNLLFYVSLPAIIFIQLTYQPSFQNVAQFESQLKINLIVYVTEPILYILETLILLALHIPTFCVYILIWLYSPLLDLGRFFSFLIFYTICRTHWMGDQPVAKPPPAHWTAQTRNKRTETSVPWVGFEPMIPVFEQAKSLRPRCHCVRLLCISH